MVDQSKIGINRPAVDGALVLEYENMLTGKSSKVSRSQCLRLGRKQTPKIPLSPDGRCPQIRAMGGLEGLRVMLTSGPSIFLTPTRTSGIALVELTSSRVDSPPRGVGDPKPPSNADCADVVDSRNEGVSVNVLEDVRERVALEWTEVLMHILSIGESMLQGKSNRLCSHKARGCVDNDSVENVVSAVGVTSMGSLVVSLN